MERDLDRLEQERRDRALDRQRKLPRVRPSLWERLEIWLASWLWSAG